MIRRCAERAGAAAPAVFWISLGLAGWTYLGYPATMALRSRLRPHPVRKADHSPTLTLLVPAYDEADVIRAKLENALALDYPRDRLQILVVDDASRDETAAIAKEFEPRGVTLVRQPHRSGKMSALNRGFREATGEIVVLSDASPLYDTRALGNLVRAFADPEVGAVVGALGVLDAESGVSAQAGMYWRYEAALRRFESLTGSTVAVHGNMLAVRRALFRPLPPATVNDEFSIAMEVIRAGYRVVEEPAALSYDAASSAMRDEFERRARINAGRYQALFSAGYLRAAGPGIRLRLFSHKLLRPLVPVFMVLMLLANAAALARPRRMAGGGWWPVALGGQTTFYGLAGLGWLAERRRRRGGVLLDLPYFFVGTNLAALAGLWRFLRGTQPITWEKRTLPPPGPDSRYVGGELLASGSAGPSACAPAAPASAIRSQK
jgi:cellulose synthase/poly-beta-1,6-N-acetylglucosamine synthase-like glycosyltransferase